MEHSGSNEFLAGVIEGFYGQPWSQTERFQLFAWMALWGLNTYLYAPKDDLKHRAAWRDLYTPTEEATLRELIQACQARQIRFIYALSPGLDIHYGSELELERLREKFAQMLSLGCHHFALLFDDIPDGLDSSVTERWGSLASAQCHLINTVFRWTRERRPDSRFLFCPTPYCGRMAERKLGGEGYLATVGRELLPEINVFWTGPEIISKEITVAHIEDLHKILHRKPLIWDNLHANDYDGRRFFCGPYSGRPPELRGAVSGILSNPNNEFPLNYVPLRTLAQFIHCMGEWDARKAYLAALQEWFPSFATLAQPVTMEDLILFGDCYYLPYEEGPEAEVLCIRAERLLSREPSTWADQASTFRQQAARLRAFWVRMTELRNRPLFYALSRRVWELREELDLLEGHVRFVSENAGKTPECRSDFHLPGTFRGGMAARLQRLPAQEPGGAFRPAGRPG